MNEHAEHHWEYSWAPAATVVGLFFLVPLTFAAFFQYGSPLFTSIFAGIGAPVLLAGIAKWTTEGMDGTEFHFGYSVPAMSVFIISETTMFLAFFAAYWYLRVTTAPGAWPPAGSVELSATTPFIVTALMTASCFAGHASHGKLKSGDIGGMRGMIIILILFGGISLLMGANEYSTLLDLGFGPSSNTYSTAFYLLTGFDLAHIFIGIVGFTCVLVPAFSGRTNEVFLRCMLMFWYMTSIIWLFVGSQLYFW